MAFHHLLMGKSVSLRVLSVVGSLEWSTISKCGCDYWGENNSFNLHSYEYATPNDVAQGGFSLFACGILLLVHVDFTVDSNSAKPVSPSWVWAEMLPMNLLILMCLCQKAHWLLFPWSLGLLVCLFIYLNYAFLSVSAFPISGCSIAPCPPAAPNYSTSNLIANLCPLLIDVGIYQLPANWASLCWSIKVPEYKRAWSKISTGGFGHLLLLSFDLGIKLEDSDFPIDL